MYNEFNKYKITSNNIEKETIETLCTNKRDSFDLQNHQKFLKAYVKSTLFDKNNRLLLYHGLGSGKTCSAISIANAFKKKNVKAKIIVITPASLVPNFYKELKGLCGITQFKEIRKQPIRKENTPCAVHNVEKVLQDVITVVSYQKFLKNLSKLGPFDKNTLFIIDEVQNIISDTGSMYTAFSKMLKNTKAAVILLSGTPVFDKPNEIAMIGNLLNTQKQLPIRLKEFMNEYGVKSKNKVDTIINVDRLQRFFENKVSYFKGSNPIAYPKKTEYLVYCPMSSFQYAGYLNSIGHNGNNDVQYGNMSTTFLISPRQCSNTVYPSGDLTKNTAKKYEKIHFSSKKHAIKFHVCVNKIRNSNGPVFVYSNFVSSCGINTFASILRNEFKFKEILPNICPTSKGDYPRYAMFRTGQTTENTRILQIYNSPLNVNGDLIKVILGSPAMKEGVTLLRTREIHLLDPYWNRSRIEQIMGRGVRFCSHRDLPIKDQVVDVYHYYAVDPVTSYGTFPCNSNTKVLETVSKTVDIHVRDMGKEKERYNKLYENILKEVAIDCPLFKHANEPPLIQCKMNNILNRVNNKTNNTKHINNTKLNNVNVSLSSYITRRKINKSERINNEEDSVKNVVKKDKTKISFDKKIIRFGSAKKKESLKGCPKQRQTNKVGNCPETHPYKRENKYGVDCCYKHMLKQPQTNNTITMRRCMSHSKKQLKEMAIPYGYSSGPITKSKLCQMIVI
jgi:hypothetical protein